MVTEEELASAVKDVDGADERVNYDESWNLIKQITVRKKAKKGDLEDPLQPILHSLNISDELFSMEECMVVKN